MFTLINGRYHKGNAAQFCRREQQRNCTTLCAASVIIDARATRGARAERQMFLLIQYANLWAETKNMKRDKS